MKQRYALGCSRGSKGCQDGCETGADICPKDKGECGRQGHPSVSCEQHNYTCCGIRGMKQSRKYCPGENTLETIIPQLTKEILNLREINERGHPNLE